MSREETTNTTDQTPAEEAAETVQPADAATTPAPGADTMAAAQKQAQEYLAGWQRERAEFNNYRKRVERDTKDTAQNAAAETILKMLPIIDDLERAFAHIPADLQGNAWIGGVTGIHRKFQKFIEDQGLTIIDPVGEQFDPSRHEAVGTEDSSDVESGHITATLQKGYSRGERVLRPALVRVAN